MRAFKTGYVLVIVTLLVLTIVLGVAAYYPAPKRIAYPAYPRVSSANDYNSTQSVEAQYQKEVDEYEEKNKDLQKEREIWVQRIFIICLIAGALLFVAGVFLAGFATTLSIGLVFSSFVLMVFGTGLISIYGDSPVTPLLGSDPEADLSLYKHIQFAVVALGAVIGVGLSFIPILRDRI